MKHLVALLVFALFLLALSACATGVVMSDAERAACKAQGCSAWTLNELRALVSASFRAGHAAGYKAGAESL